MASPSMNAFRAGAGPAIGIAGREAEVPPKGTDKTDRIIEAHPRRKFPNFLVALISGVKQRKIVPTNQRTMLFDKPVWCCRRVVSSELSEFSLPETRLTERGSRRSVSDRDCAVPCWRYRDEVHASLFHPPPVKGLAPNFDYEYLQNEHKEEGKSMNRITRMEASLLWIGRSTRGGRSGSALAVAGWAGKQICC